MVVVCIYNFFILYLVDIEDLTRVVISYGIYETSLHSGHLVPK